MGWLWKFLKALFAPSEAARVNDLRDGWQAERASGWAEFVSVATAAGLTSADLDAYLAADTEAEWHAIRQRFEAAFAAPQPEPEPEPGPALLPLTADKVFVYFTDTPGRWGFCLNYAKVAQDFPCVRCGPWEVGTSDSDLDGRIIRMGQVFDRARGRLILALEAGEEYMDEAGIEALIKHVYAKIGHDRWINDLICIELVDEPQSVPGVGLPGAPAYVQLLVDRVLWILARNHIPRKPLAVSSPVVWPGIIGLTIHTQWLYTPNPNKDRWEDDGIAFGRIVLGAQAIADEIERAGYVGAAVLQAYARNENGLGVLGPPWSGYGLSNQRIAAGQLTHGAQWCERNAHRLAYVGLFSGNRWSGMCSDETPDVHEVLYPVAEKLPRRLNGQGVEYPALPPDPRPGPGHHFRMLWMRHKAGPGAHQPGVQHPTRGGHSSFKLVAVDAQGREWSHQWENRREVRCTQWVIEGPGMRAVVDVDGARTNAPFAWDYHSWQKENDGYAPFVFWNDTPAGTPVTLTVYGEWQGKAMRPLVVDLGKVQAQQ